MCLDDTARIRLWIERLRMGDESAVNELLVHFERRLLRLTRKMLGRYPGVRRWEQTEDVYQLASLRLRRALLQVSPGDSRQLFGLAALQIRRELLNMARSYHCWASPSHVGQEGAAHLERNGQGRIEKTCSEDDGPSQVAEWTEFHRVAEALPAREREVFDLLWYHGLTQVEAAKTLGIPERTLRSRWHDARLRIYHDLGGRLPGV
jgi:RNA polymerase sigma factor (sigma-70 family)